MGAIAEGLVAYAQPLIDATDGSLEQMNHAFAVSQLCFNLALLSEDKQDASISEMRLTLQMNEEEFQEYRDSVIIPMIERHHLMFPGYGKSFSRIGQDNPNSARDIIDSSFEQPTIEAPVEIAPVTDRYAPCPCNSGKKYKFCCGKKRH